MERVRRYASRFVAVLFLVLLCVPRTVTADAFTIDQANDFVVNFTNPYGFGTSIKFNSPIGQEFVPDLWSLDFVELRLDLAFQDEGDFLINIRAGAVTGPIAGTSGITHLTLGPTVQPGYDIRHFDFPIPVSLMPGDLL